MNKTKESSLFFEELKKQRISQDIELNEGTVCDRCDFAIKCPNCSMCACDRPGSKIKKKK